jgi:arginine decarboxylase
MGDHKYVPEELQGIQSALADVYHGNLSVFQSLPDVWAIDQIFPIMPVHRLAECPTRLGTISDITCDCDGKITRFVDLQDVSPTLRLHEMNGQEYILGVFLAGAYQETLGDLHNLFGDTNVVNIRIGEKGEIEYVREFDGDTVADVLSYVEYTPAEMVERVRAQAERAVRLGLLTPQERREIMDAYETGLRGYTYFEQ